MNEGLNYCPYCGRMVKLINGTEGLQICPECGISFENTAARIGNLVGQRLRKLFRDRPKHEVDVQNQLEKLLIATDYRYSREGEMFEYSSRSYRPDFTLRECNLVIEVKLCEQSNREKRLVKEINDDILAYLSRYSSVLFVVYDLGFINDTDRFASDLQRHPGVFIQVVKH